MGVWYSRDRKLKPKGISRSSMAKAILPKNHMTKATTRIADAIWAAHWIIWACRHTGMP